MAKIQNSVNLYSPNTIIVDSAGKTPFTTVAAGITAAVGLGTANPTVYIRAGTYTENLTLVNGVNLCGDDKYTTIIDGHHTVPAAGQIQISNLKLAASVGATSVFIEAGAGTCAIDVIDCIFNITSGMVFNLPLSNGALSITGCSDISAANSIINNTTGAGILSIINSTVGTGAVAAAIKGATYLESVRIICPINQTGTQTITAFNSHFAATIVQADTSVLIMNNCSMDVGAVIAITVGAGCTATLSNVVINSTVGGGNCITGAGSCTFAGVTYVNATGVTVTTKDYSTRIGVGELQINPVSGVGALYGVSGLVTSTAAMTDGQILIGSTGVAPALGTITAGSGISVSNGAGTVTVATTTMGLVWSDATADFTLAVNNGYNINHATPANKMLCTLPATATIGQRIEIVGSTAGGWKVVQNANQYIRLGNQVSVTGAAGYIEFTNQYDSVELTCIVAGASTGWRVTKAVGNITVA
jgi:hypothetical protein